MAFYRNRRFTIWQLIIIGLIALAMVAFSILRHSLRLGYVDSAIVSVRTVVAAETKFAQAHPDLGYTCTLSQLPASSYPELSDKLIARLAKDDRRNGYAFKIDGCRAADGKTPNVTYFVTARPLHGNMPAFCADQSEILKFDGAGSVTKCLQSGNTWP